MANARTADKTNYLEVLDTTSLTVFVQGTNLTQSVQMNATVSESQPLGDLSLVVGGGTAKIANSSDATETNSLSASSSASLASSSASLASSSASLASTSAKLANSSASGSLSQVAETKNTASSSASTSAATSGFGGLVATSTATQSALASSSSSAKVASSSAATASPIGILNLEVLAAFPKTKATVIEAPIMVGKAKPNVNVKIQIHSETLIEQTVVADALGNFELDVSQFQDLEAGEHTVTYSYTDPATGQEVSKTQTFTVAPKGGGKLAMATQPALAATNSTPTPAVYGSGNPYPITSPTKGSTKSADTSTRSAVVSTTSGSYKTGNVGNTVALVVGGIFLMAIGWWSWWLAGLAKDEV